MTADRRGELLDYAAVRAPISIGYVLALLDYQPLRTAADKCRGRCPLHEADQPGSKSTCFSVNLQRSIFNCFGCGAGGDQLDLWRLHIRRPLFPATLELCRRVGITPPRLPASATRKSPATKSNSAKNETPLTDKLAPILTATDNQEGRSETRLLSEGSATFIRRYSASKSLAIFSGGFQPRTLVLLERHAMAPFPCRQWCRDMADKSP